MLLSSASTWSSRSAGSSTGTGEESGGGRLDMAVEFCKAAGVGVTRMFMTHNWKCDSHCVTEERKKIFGG